MADATLVIGTLSAVAASPTSTTITQSAAPSGGSGSGYTVTLYRDVTSGFTPSDSNKVATDLGTTHTDTGLTANTKYYYIAVATDSDNNTATSNTASVTTEAYPAVTIGTVSATVASATSVTVDLSAGAAGGSGTGLTTTLWRSTDPSMTQGSATHQVGKNLTFPYTDTSLTAGDEVYYMVVASDDAGNTKNSNIANATPTNVSIGALTATAVTGGIQIAAASSPTGGSGSGYSVSLYRAAAAGVATSAANLLVKNVTLPYTDTTATAGKEAYYIAAVADGAGDTGTSNEVSATMPIPAIVVGTLSLTVNSEDLPVIATSAVPSGGSGDLSTDLYRGTVSGFAPSVDTLIEDDVVFPYTDTGVQAGDTYYYVAVTTDASGTTAQSNEVALTSGGLIPPSAVKDTLIVSMDDLYGAVGEPVVSPTATVTGATGDVTLVCLQTLPAGLEGFGDNQFFGTPTREDTARVTILATDSLGKTGRTQVNIFIYPALTIVPSTTLMRYAGEDLRCNLRVVGGVGTVQMVLTGLSCNQNQQSSYGNLILDPLTGVLSGSVPTSGEWTVEFEVSDANVNVDGSQTFNVLPARLDNPGMPSTAAVGYYGANVATLLDSYVSGRKNSEYVNSGTAFIEACLGLTYVPSSEALLAFASMYQENASESFLPSNQLVTGMSIQDPTQVDMAVAINDAFIAVYVTGGTAARHLDVGNLLALTSCQDLVLFLERAAQSYNPNA